MKILFATGLMLLSMNVFAQAAAKVTTEQGVVIAPIPAEASLLSGRLYRLVLNCAGLNDDLKRVDEVIRKRIPMQINPIDADQPASQDHVIVDSSPSPLNVQDRQLLLERSHIERLRSDFRCTQ